MTNRLPQVTPADTLKDSARLLLAAMAVVRSLPDAQNQDRLPWEEIANRLTVNYTNHEYPGVTVDAAAMGELIRVLTTRGVLE